MLRYLSIVKMRTFVVGPFCALEKRYLQYSRYWICRKAKCFLIFLLFVGWANPKRHKRHTWLLVEEMQACSVLILQTALELARHLIEWCIVPTHQPGAPHSM